MTASLVLATAYDSREVAYEKYPDCAANVSALEALGARALFSVDAANLERTAEVRSQPGGWTKVVWNFPHAGAGEKDQARNVALNQALLLRFLRSVSPFLAKGPTRVAEVAKKGKGKGKDKERAAAEDEDDEEGLDLDLGSDGEYAFDGRADEDDEREARKGTILITLRDAEPYKTWSVRFLFSDKLPASGARRHPTFPGRSGTCPPSCASRLRRRRSRRSRPLSVLRPTRHSRRLSRATRSSGRLPSTRASTRATPTGGRSGSSPASAPRTTRRSTAAAADGRSRPSSSTSQCFPTRTARPRSARQSGRHGARRSARRRRARAGGEETASRTTGTESSSRRRPAQVGSGQTRTSSLPQSPRVERWIMRI